MWKSRSLKTRIKVKIKRWIPFYLVESYCNRDAIQFSQKRVQIVCIVLKKQTNKKTKTHFFVWNQVLICFQVGEQLSTMSVIRMWGQYTEKDGEMKEGQKAGRDPDQSYLPKSDKNKDAHSPASIPQTFSGGETFLVLQKRTGFGPWFWWLEGPNVATTFWLRALGYTAIWWKTGQVQKGSSVCCGVASQELIPGDQHQPSPVAFPKICPPPGLTS